MQYTTDTTFLLVLFILPSLFGLTLIGDGVNKLMNYDDHGWIGVSIGSVFVVVLIIAFLIMSTRAIG